MLWVYLLISLLINAGGYNGARILGVFPSSSFSHQSVFRVLVRELASRGHDMVVINASPKFPYDRVLPNLREINVRNATAGLREQVHESATGNSNDIFKQVQLMISTFSNTVHSQLETVEVQAFISDKNQHFDLLLIEACMPPALIFSHLYKAPVIMISSVGTIDQFIDWTGADMHPFLYPTVVHQRLYNLSIYEKVYELIKLYVINRAISLNEAEDDKILRKKFGIKVPPLSELKKNVDMVFIDCHRLWDSNRPVPPNVIYLGALHLANKSKEDLPKDLEAYLNSSQDGVVFMSLGTNTKPSILSEDRIQTLLKAFSRLPYNVILKWDKDKLLGLPDNVRLFNWLPQSDLLMHEKIKLFITQCGLQSITEAIIAGVPIIGIPMLGDQWYNVEQIVRHNIGLRIDIEELSEDVLVTAIKTVVEDESYRSNIIALRERMFDEPQSALDRAVWWSEHIIRHKGGKHLLASGAGVSWTEYYELGLIGVVSLSVSLVIALIIALIYMTLIFVRKMLRYLFSYNIPQKIKIF